MKEHPKMFIIRKRILAKSAREAIKMDKKAEVDDVFMDEEWYKLNMLESREMGFTKNDK